MTKPYDISSYADFDAQQKVIWSPFHQEAIIMGLHAVYLGAQTQQVVQASSTHTFVDIDVANDGTVLLVLAPVGSGEWSARLMSSDFTKILRQVRSTTVSLSSGAITGHQCFVVGGRDSDPPATADSLSSSSSSSSSASALASSVPGSSSSSDSSSSSSGTKAHAFRFFLVGKQTVSVDISSAGQLVRIMHEPGWTTSLAVISDGDVVEIASSAQGLAAKVVKNIGSAITAAAAGANRTLPGESPQTMARVYVGSLPWQADRWDSGVLVTDNKAILYGGGDNLVPGQPYWVHIAVYHADSGWSAPSIEKFVVPRE